MTFDAKRYVVENRAPGKLWSIDLSSKIVTPIVISLYLSSGLVIDSAAAYAYVSENPPGTSYFVISKVSKTIKIQGEGEGEEEEKEEQEV